MNVSVTGKQLDVGDALRAHIEDTVSAVAEKYFTNSLDSHVVVSREGSRYRADVSVHVGRSITLQSHGEGGDAYTAVDAAVERAAKRLRRYKRRLRDHHKERGPEIEALPAQQYILAGIGEGEHGDAEAHEGQADSPVVIAEMATAIESLTVGEAVMRMDLADQNALLFHNRASGNLNMVYRRNDGNVGWVDPKNNDDRAD